MQKDNFYDAIDYYVASQFICNNVQYNREFLDHQKICRI